MSEQPGSAAYEQQLSEKVSRLSRLLAPFDAPDIQVFASASQHYRMRAEFRVWHEGDDLYHIMFDQQTKEKYRVDEFAPASTTINRAMDMLLALVRPNEVLRKNCFR